MMKTAMHGAPTLRVEDLTIAAGVQVIVRNLSFSVHAGETVGIVGESGSGKTMSAYAIAGLLPAGVDVRQGAIHLDGRSLTNLADGERRGLSGRSIGIVLQDRLCAFNPVRTIGSLLTESALRHRAIDKAGARALSIERLASVRLPEPEKIVDCYPHQLSGGQLQRAMIALATLNDPALLIADEPTTALDPIVQLQLLALLRSSAAKRALVLITHDVRIAAAMCDRLLVMYRGDCIEQGLTRQIIDRPQQAYTRHLLAGARVHPSSVESAFRSVSNL